MLGLGLSIWQAALGGRGGIRPGTASLLWTGYPPGVTGVTQFVSPGVGAATWTGYPPDISKLATLAPGVAATTWTGPAPSVSGLQAEGQILTRDGAEVIDRSGNAVVDTR